jgi:hypothetical protein
MYHEWEQAVVDAAAGYDRPRAAQAADNLIFAVDDGQFVPTEAAAARVLKALKGARYFDLMQSVAEAYRRTDALADQLTSLLVQALIEQKQLAKAIHLARAAEARLAERETSADEVTEERAELIGLLGRGHKQRYLDTRGTPRCRDRDLLAAIDYYGSLDHRRWRWHGLNHVACLSLAIRDQIQVPGIDHPQQTVLDRAREIRTAIGPDPQAGIPIWDLASAAECSLAIYLQTGTPADLGTTLQWLGAYVDHSGGNAFEYNSTLRQWTEVWELTIDKSPGSFFLQVLEGELLKHRGAYIENSQQDLEARREAFATAVSEDLNAADLQARFGREGATRYTEWKRAESRAFWVCKIHPCGDPLNVKGTGFLLRGRLLADSLADKYYVLTNDHVVSDNPQPYQREVLDGQSMLPLSSDQAFVTCELAGAANLAVGRVVANSFYKELDFALLELKEDFQPQLDQVPELELGADLPAVPLVPEQAQRMFVIGYPGGSELAFSMSDNFVIDHEGPPAGRPQPSGRVRLHYRSPTQKGSSGSPVFDRQWKLIALHHAGGMLGRLNGKPGRDFANEGIWIESIRRHLAGT